MKCPKCGFNSFESLDTCKKCGKDLTAFKASFSIRPLVQQLQEDLPTAVPEDAEAGAALGPDVPCPTDLPGSSEHPPVTPLVTAPAAAMAAAAPPAEADPEPQPDPAPPEFLSLDDLFGTESPLHSTDKEEAVVPPQREQPRKEELTNSASEEVAVDWEAAVPVPSPSAPEVSPAGSPNVEAEEAFTSAPLLSDATAPDLQPDDIDTLGSVEWEPAHFSALEQPRWEPPQHVEHSPSDKPAAPPSHDAGMADFSLEEFIDFSELSKKEAASSFGTGRFDVIDLTERKQEETQEEAEPDPPLPRL